jgi:hypothetical protein
MNIVKGEMNGDTFVYEHLGYDADGAPQHGAWKSRIDAGEA